MPKTSLDVLEELLANIRELESRGMVRETRLASPKLLHSPTKADEDWFMYIDERFNAALDLAQTKRMSEAGATIAWTQGSNFSVTKGDIFYDNKDAYGPWNPKAVKRCFVVTQAAPVASGSKESPNSPIKPRHPGSVSFDILEPNKAKDNLVKTGHRSVSQDEFIGILIRGLDQQLTLG